MTDAIARQDPDEVRPTVLGRSKPSRQQSLTRGSVIQQILHMASDEAIDVHGIARLTEPSGRPPADDEG